MNLYKEAGYRPNILFCSSDSESILMMVAAEEGVSILPDYCTYKLYQADNLVFVPLVGEQRAGGDSGGVAEGSAKPGAAAILIHPAGYGYSEPGVSVRVDSPMGL